MRSNVRNLCIAGTMLGVALLTTSPTTAGAAPAKAKTSQRLALHCIKLGDVEIIRNGNGTWVPGHVVGSTRVLKPYEIHITGTFTPAAGAPEPIDQHSVKAAPKSRKLDECTFHVATSDAKGSTSADGQVKVQYSGKRLP